MFISNVSIKRPVFATMINVLLVIFGLFALPRLSVDLYPAVDFPVITVTVVYPGADPESVEQRILDPLEDALNGLAGLKMMASQGYPNVGQMVLQFNLDKDSDSAAQEVRDKVFATVGKLPHEAETPVVQKFNIGGAPIISLALSGEMGIAALSTLAKDTVLPLLERIDGVAQVNPAGLREREVHILIDLERLASFGLTPGDLANSVRQQNMDLPSGRVEDQVNYRTIRLKGRLTRAEEIADLPVLNNRNINLRISDVATVKDTIAPEENAAFIAKQPTILLAIQKQSGANTTTVAHGVKKAVEHLNTILPKNSNLTIVTDNSLHIESSIDAVKLDLVLGALLAVLIVLLFLRDLRITLISAVALPTAVIATFAFMQYMGFTLNMMSTLALSLSIGILIDDAIIVVENIHRHLAMGKSGMEAARDASSEIGLAVFATTLSLCAVFVPVAFMEGIIGRFFFQFGLTVAFAVMVSLFVAFTLTPMLASKFLVHHHEGRKGLWQRFGQRIEGVLTALDSVYRKILAWCLEHRLLTLAGGFITFILSIVMLKYVPVAFFPQEDRSEFAIQYTLPEGRNITYTKARSLELASAVQSYPGVKEVVTDIAAGGDKKPNKAALLVKLVSKDKRQFTQRELMERMRKDLIPVFHRSGAEVVISDSEAKGGGRTEPIQFIFKSNDWQKLIAFTDQVAIFTRAHVPGTVDVITSKPKPQMEFKVRVDTAKAADLSITPAQIATAVRSLFEGEKVGDILLDGRATDVYLRVAAEQRLGADDIAKVTLTNMRGEPTPLSAVATIEAANSPSAIERLDGQRQITVAANFTGKDLNGAVNLIQGYVDKNMPEGVSMTLSGQAEIMKNSMIAMLQALLLAVILVFMILCAQYESYLSPLVIMAALPLSLTGAFGALLITGQTMSVFTMIGIILLMGLVTKNGILLVDCLTFNSVVPSIMIVVEYIFILIALTLT